MTKAAATLAAVRYEKLRHIHIGIYDILSGSRHEHSAMELGMVLRGTVTVCDSSSYTASVGDLLLFNAYTPHQVSACGTEPVRVLYLRISNLFGEETVRRIGCTVFDTAALRTLQKPVLQTLRTRLLTAALAFFRETEAFQFECVGNVNLLLTELLRILPHAMRTDNQSMTKKKNLSRSSRIAGYLEQHYTQKLTLSMLAETERLSCTYMSKVFRELFGMSFQEYLNLLRLERALPLLRDPQVYLIDICIECGFSDARYLNKLCCKVFGCTAAEYRRLWQDKKLPDIGGGLWKSGTSRQCGNAESLRLLESFIAKT